MAAAGNALSPNTATIIGLVAEGNNSVFEGHLTSIFPSHKNNRSFTKP